MDSINLPTYGLERYHKDIGNIENRFLNLIYDANFDRVVDYDTYEKTLGLMSWKCAICGRDILIDKTKTDVDNFVCEQCRKEYNDSNSSIDFRILDSRNRMFKFIEKQLYEEFEDCMGLK